LKQLYKINLYRLYFAAQTTTLMGMWTEPLLCCKSTVQLSYSFSGTNYV